MHMPPATPVERAEAVALMLERQPGTNVVRDELVICGEGERYTVTAFVPTIRAQPQPALFQGDRAGLVAWLASYWSQ